MLRVNRIRWTYALGVLTVMLLATACGSADKTPAEAAIKAADAALAAVRGEAAKFVPDQLKAVEDGRASCRERV